jgi:DNA polymerase-3 subunit delta
MKLYELRQALEKNGPAPLYAVLGDEDALRDEALATLRNAVVQDPGLADFNVDIIYGDETDAAEMLAKACEAPVFAPRRLLILKAADKLAAKEGERLIEYLKEPCESTTVVVVAAKLDGRTKFAQTLKEHARVVECGPLAEPQMLAWLRAQAGRLDLKVAEDALVFLKDLASSHSLSLVAREMEKLAAYVPVGQVAGRADLEAVRGSEVGASVFDLATAIGACDRMRVLRILVKNIENGEAPLRILGSLVWQYRQIWKAKENLAERREGDAARLLRLPPFKTREFLNGFSDRHLPAAFRLFAEADSRLKGGSATDPARLLDGLALELCALAAASRRAPDRKAPAASASVSRPVRPEERTGR